MRHNASLLVSLEGSSRAGYRIARELTNNSRSGLTTRFLSKKLEMPEEEIEYILDVNPRLIFLDLTKVKLVPEGHQAIKRIADGLENHGDIPSLMRRVKALSPHDFRRLEELIGLDQPVTKKAAAERLIEKYYKHPDSVVTYVGTRGFSEKARELFDIVWQSNEGLMPASQLRVAHGGRESEIERALWELFQGFALFEMFRFDSEDRLVRVVGLLSELRQWRDQSDRNSSGASKLLALKKKPERVRSQGLDFSDRICRLVAAIAAKPVRLRGDGELFREDRRRLSEICSDDDDPSMSTCLWVAEGVGWLARVDNELRAGNLDTLIPMNRIERHRVLYDWLMSRGDDRESRAIMSHVLDDLKSGAWYPVMQFLRFAVNANAENDQPYLKSTGAHWEYVSPGESGQTEARLARALEETFYWLGLVDRSEVEGDSVFQITRLGEAFLGGIDDPKLHELYPEHSGEFVVQPNFDIVVPVQDMDPLLTVPLDQFAVRASTGQATVYNVTRESFVEAVQEGHDAGAFVDFLMRHNRGDSLPANVTMTLEDWGGAIKRVRLKTIHVLESEDPLVLADLLHRRRLSKYFAQIDPAKVVAYEGITKRELTKALEKDGFIVE